MAKSTRKINVTLVTFISVRGNKLNSRLRKKHSGLGRKFSRVIMILTSNWIMSMGNIEFSVYGMPIVDRNLVISGFELWCFMYILSSFEGK